MGNLGYNELWGDYETSARSKRARTSTWRQAIFRREEEEYEPSDEEADLDPLALLAQAALAEGADSDSDGSEPRKRVKRRHSSVSGDDLGLPAEAERFQTSDSEALPARGHFDDPPGMHYNGVSLPGGASSNFRGNLTGSSLAAAPLGMNSHADSHPPPSKETFLPGQTLNKKRCASHVYIARFIEYQSNKLRLQRQRPPSNGYATSNPTVNPTQQPAASETPERSGAANGTFHKASLPVLAEPTVAHLPAHSQVPTSGISHSFMPSQQFPASSLPHSLQGLPPQYAQMLAQQHGMGGMAAGFPFLQGLQFNGSLAQQQAAVATALASQQNMMDLEKIKALVPLGGSLNGMPPHLIAALSSFSQSAINGKPGGPPPQTSSLPQPPRKAEQQNGMRPLNGTTLKMEDDSTGLQRLGTAPTLMSANGQADVSSAMEQYMLLEAFKKGHPQTLTHLPMDPWGGVPPGTTQKM